MEALSSATSMSGRSWAGTRPRQSHGVLTLPESSGPSSSLDHPWGGQTPSTGQGGGVQGRDPALSLPKGLQLPLLKKLRGQRPSC